MSTDAVSSWHDQPIAAPSLGGTRTLGSVKGGKLYHGTGAALAPGTVLEPGHGKNFRQSGECVSLSSDLTRAWSWALRAGVPRESIRVYEVEPLGEVAPWRVGPADSGQSWILWEGRVPRARVIAAFTPR